MAPEMLQNEPYEGSQIDVFGAGVILFKWVTGLHPCKKSAEESDGLFSKLVNNPDEFWKEIERQRQLQQLNVMTPLSPTFKDFVEKLLAIDPEDRISLAEIKTEPWLLLKCPAWEEVQAEMRRRYKIIIGVTDAEKLVKSQKEKDGETKRESDGVRGGVDEAKCAE
jgi:serine/threonine protein kinase